jgi:phage replication O-like protein O
MTETPSKIIPNSFQTPNFFIDGCLAYLTGNEFKCLSFLARKTFGWQKRSDRIAKSQIAVVTGLNSETVDNCMEKLVAFGLVVRMAENNIGNDGVEWALETDDGQVRFDLMEERQKQLDQVDRQRTEKARKKRIEKGGGLSNNPTPELPSVEQKPDGGGIVQQPGGQIVQQPQGGIVQQSPQKPIKAKEKNMGANAPARVSHSSPADRIQAFPKDCREGVRLLFEIFYLLPPERPAPTDKGGEFALWINGIRGLVKLAASYQTPLQEALELAHAHWNRAPFNLAHPAALKKTMTSALAQTSASKAPAPEPAARLLGNFKPRGD